MPYGINYGFDQGTALNSVASYQFDQGTAYTIGNQTINDAYIQNAYIQYTGTTVTTGNYYYQSYPTTCATQGITNFVVGVVSTFTPETDEQRIEREQRERDQKAKDEARSKRAREALLLTLNRNQQEQFEKEQHFELQVNGRLYRVRPGCRVERLNPADKKILSYFCIHPDLSHDLPPEDVAISQKLWLEADEATFLKIANETSAA